MWRIKNISSKIKYFLHKNNKKILWLLLAFVAVTSLTILLSYLFKILSVNEWSAVSAIGQVLGALATTAAVIVALSPKKPKIEIDFKVLEPDANDDKVAKIFIFNVSESIAIIHSIEISLYKVPNSILAFESFNSLKDGFRDYREPISILPYQKEVIEIHPNAMLWGLGHTIDKPDEDTKGKYIKLTITVNEKKFMFKTDISYEHYYRMYTNNNYSMFMTYD